MPHLENGNASEVMKADVAFLRRRFEPWQRRYLAWEKLVYPTFDDDRISARDGLERGREVLKKRARSQFRSDFIWTGCLALVNWLSVSNLRVEMPVRSSRAENAKLSATERFVVGMLNMLDEQVRGSGTGTSWKRSVASQAVVAGKIVGFPHLRERRTTTGKTWEFTCELYHPYQCYYDFRSKGLRRFVYEEVLDRSMLRDLFYDELAEAEEGSILLSKEPGYTRNDDEPYKVSHYWVEEPNEHRDGFDVWYGIQVDDEPALLRRTALQRLAVVVQSINALGAMHQELQGAREVKSQEFVERSAEPWYAALENVISSYNDFRSLELDNIDWMVRPPVITRPGDDGETWVVQDERFGPAVQLNLRPGQVIEFLQVQSKAAEANASIGQAMLQELFWALPAAIRGESQSANESGYHFDLRRNQQELALADLHMGCSAFTDRVAQEFIQQVRDAGAEVELKGRALTGKSMGHFFEERFNAQMLPEGHPIRVYYAPAIPEDNAKAVTIYEREVASGALDTLTARSRTMGVQDPVTVGERVQQDKIEARPEFQDSLLVSTFYDEAARLEFEATQSESPERQRALRFRAKVARNWGEATERRLSGAAPPFQMKEEPRGINPEHMPPQQGPENPEEMRQIAGVAPAGGRPRGSTRRRPQGGA